MDKKNCGKRFAASNFDLKQTEESGQCFRWKRIGEGEYLIPSGDKVLKISQNGQDFFAECSDDDWNQTWCEYFDFNTDYRDFERKIRESGDEHIVECFLTGKGIRILKQNLWETIVTFLISQNNNIPRIKNSVEKICELGGKNVLVGNLPVYLFPEPCDISPEAFNDPSLGLGYRNEYLREMFEYTGNHPEWLRELKKMPYEEAKKILMEKKGIGPKVADCICLFGLHCIDAFPIDTHVKQLMAKYYPKGLDLTPFEGFKGVIQQYLFYYEIKKPTR